MKKPHTRSKFIIHKSRKPCYCNSERNPCSLIIDPDTRSKKPPLFRNICWDDYVPDWREEKPKKVTHPLLTASNIFASDLWKKPAIR